MKKIFLIFISFALSISCKNDTNANNHQLEWKSINDFVYLCDSLNFDTYTDICVYRRGVEKTNVFYHIEKSSNNNKYYTIKVNIDTGKILSVTKHNENNLSVSCAKKIIDIIWKLKISMIKIDSVNNIYFNPFFSDKFLLIKTKNGFLPQSETISYVNYNDNWFIMKRYVEEKYFDNNSYKIK
jgi:hypothetical protein